MPVPGLFWLLKSSSPSPCRGSRANRSPNCNSGARRSGARAGGFAAVSSAGVGEVPGASQLLRAINKSLKGRAEEQKKSFGSTGSRAQAEPHSAEGLNTALRAWELGRRGVAG